MREFLYLEVPTPDTGAVLTWLQQTWSAPGLKRCTIDGLVLRAADGQGELSIFVWSLQRTTYLKVFGWGSRPFPQEKTVVTQLQQQIETAFPPQYPALPDLDLSQGDIFTALAPYYPQTVHFFQKFPQGAYDLQRVYWWEKRWRDNARNPQQPPTVIFDQPQPAPSNQTPDYDLIYIGGALGVIHAAVMAQRGYRVLLIERMPFGRMNREWNISRGEFQRLIDLGLFTPAEFEALIAREYQDGFNIFFDAYNPPHLKAKVLPRRC
jgi:lycopene cyclase CruA